MLKHDTIAVLLALCLSCSGSQEHSRNVTGVGNGSGTESSADAEPLAAALCEGLELQPFTPAEWDAAAPLDLPGLVLAFAGESPRLISVVLQTDTEGRRWLAWDVEVDDRAFSMEPILEQMRTVLGEGSVAESAPVTGWTVGDDGEPMEVEQPPYARGEVTHGACTLQFLVNDGGPPLVITFRAGGQPGAATLGQALAPSLGLRPRWFPETLVERFSDLPVTAVELSGHSYTVPTGFAITVDATHQASIAELDTLAAAAGLRTRLIERERGGWLLSLRVPADQ